MAAQEQHVDTSCPSEDSKPALVALQSDQPHDLSDREISIHLAARWYRVALGLPSPLNTA